ncbi:MAG TPA: glutamate racemase [Chitinophagaceae bacterium]|nr:glutamate racemase [Chitinophagaceae bacterium]
MAEKYPIGFFDSGYGGLTVLREVVRRLPQYDYLYLGDNARTPYGNRSFQTVYQYTLQCVTWLLNQGCPLVIVACNTASAKALRTIQQNDLERMAPGRRVLGVIRPTTEIIGRFTETGQVGILATRGTVSSQSYPIEIARFYPHVIVHQEACPMWVPLVENNEHLGHGADYFVRKNLNHLFQQGPAIDVVLLACTHYPLLRDKITDYLPVGVRLLAQGEIVAESLSDYLARHPEIEGRCSREGRQHFFTTDSAEEFDRQALVFFGQSVRSKQVQLD